MLLSQQDKIEGAQVPNFQFFSVQQSCRKVLNHSRTLPQIGIEGLYKQSILEGMADKIRQGFVAVPCYLWSSWCNHGAIIVTWPASLSWVIFLHLYNWRMSTKSKLESRNQCPLLIVLISFRHWTNPSQICSKCWHKSPPPRWNCLDALTRSYLPVSTRILEAQHVNTAGGVEFAGFLPRSPS